MFELWLAVSLKKLVASCFRLLAVKSSAELTAARYGYVIDARQLRPDTPGPEAGCAA